VEGAGRGRRGKMEGVAVSLAMQESLHEHVFVAAVISGRSLC
jgi:hypothetical protein